MRKGFPLGVWRLLSERFQTLTRILGIPLLSMKSSVWRSYYPT